MQRQGRRSQRRAQYTLYGTGRSYRYSRHRAAVVVSGMDSVLEAFKHNPTDGSVSPLAAQLSENTNYLNQRFLSY